jgi:hypothetical protein
MCQGVWVAECLIRVCPVFPPVPILLARQALETRHLETKHLDTCARFCLFRRFAPRR